MQLWKDVYVIPETIIWPIGMITFINFIYILFFGSNYPQHTHMIQYCVEHKFRYHSFNYCILKYKTVSLLKLIHMINIIYTTFPSSSCLSPNKLNRNMANIFDNEGIWHLFGFRIFVVCSIMLGKGNHWIVSFVKVGQYKLL